MVCFASIFYPLCTIDIYNFADLVLQVLQSAADSSESKIAHEQLQAMQTEVIDLAQNYSRASVSKAD